MFYTYILKSLRTSKYYIGCTNNLKSRLNRHNTRLVTSTSREIPWQTVYSEVFIDLKTARKRESQIKHWKSRVAIERLINKNLVQNRGSTIPTLSESGSKL